MSSRRNEGEVSPLVKSSAMDTWNDRAYGMKWRLNSNASRIPECSKDFREEIKDRAKERKYYRRHRKIKQQKEIAAVDQKESTSVDQKKKRCDEKLECQKEREKTLRRENCNAEMLKLFATSCESKDIDQQPLVVVTERYPEYTEALVDGNIGKKEDDESTKEEKQRWRHLSKKEAVFALKQEHYDRLRRLTERSIERNPNFEEIRPRTERYQGSYSTDYQKSRQRSTSPPYKTDYKKRSLSPNNQTNYKKSHCRPPSPKYQPAYKKSRQEPPSPNYQTDYKKSSQRSPLPNYQTDYKKSRHRSPSPYGHSKSPNRDRLYGDGGRYLHGEGSGTKRNSPSGARRSRSPRKTYNDYGGRR